MEEILPGLLIYSAQISNFLRFWNRQCINAENNILIALDDLVNTRKPNFEQRWSFFNWSSFLCFSILGKTLETI